MATIKDIARLSGYGVGTVSRVLNGGINVKKETREKILAVAKQENYKPNKTARNLARQNYSETTIGIALPSVIHPFYFEIVKGIHEAIRHTDFHLLMFNIGDSRRQVFEHIVNEEPAGLLVIGDKMIPEAHELLIVNDIKYMYLDHHEEDEHCFYFNNETGGVLAAEYLLKNGCRNIAYIGEDIPSQQQNERIRGFKKTLANQASLKEYHITLDEKRSAELTGEIIGNTETDGIFYFCDTLAYGGRQAIRESGKNISIIGYDDMQPSRHLGISSIRQPAYLMGYESIEAIIKQIIPGCSGLLQKVFQPELITRLEVCQ